MSDEIKDNKFFYYFRPINNINEDILSDNNEYKDKTKQTDHYIKEFITIYQLSRIFKNNGICELKSK